MKNKSDYSNRSDCENINDKRHHRWHPGKAFSDEASVKKIAFAESTGEVYSTGHPCFENIYSY